METIIRGKIVDHLKENNLITWKQYGFMSGHSTVLQLITVMKKWTSILDEGGVVDIAYCDFKKTFDMVPHRRLLEKVKSFSIGSDILEWISEFLRERKQRVIVNGVSSDWMEVISGVPRVSAGSTLVCFIY